MDVGRAAKGLKERWRPKDPFGTACSREGVGAARTAAGQDVHEKTCKSTPKAASDNSALPLFASAAPHK